MEFAADSLKLDIIELAQSGNKLLLVAGRPEWMCQAVEVADPVTFTTPDTVLVSPSVPSAPTPPKAIHHDGLRRRLSLSILITAPRPF